MGDWVVGAVRVSVNVTGQETMMERKEEEEEEEEVEKVRDAGRAGD